MSKYNKVLILLTPFQVRQFVRVKDQFELNFERTLVFHSSVVKIDETINNALNSNFKAIEIPKFDISLKNILKSPLKEIPKHRNYVKKLKSFIDSNWSIFDNRVDLYIGTEKDIFSQLLINKLKSKASLQSLIAIEEGLGFYTNTSSKDKILQFIYPIITPIIFGAKLNFYSCLGTHPLIDKVYARFIKQLPYKKNRVNYFEISPDKNLNNNSDETKKDLLLYTSPLSEDRHISMEKEIEILDGLFHSIHKLNLSCDIKAHPREMKNKYSGYLNDDIKEVDASLSGESLDYFNYTRIVHFGSSLILDIHQKGFPLSDIVTIDMEYSNQPITQELFGLGTHLFLSENNLIDKFEQSLTGEKSAN